MAIGEIHRQETSLPDVFTPRYDLTGDEVHSLCQEFLASPERKLPESRFGCYIVQSDHPYSNLGRYVESTVFYETFGNDPELFEKEYGPYDKSSEFYIAIDHKAEIPIGVMRVIKNSEAGLKYFEDLSKLELGFTKEDICRGYGADPNRCAEVGTLAVLEKYRGDKYAHLPSLLTYRTLFLQILNNPDFDYVLAMIDKKAERNLNLLKFPFEPVFESGYFSYLDSEETRALIAKTTMFEPQLTYWIDRFRQESDGGGIKAMLADVIDSLINPRNLDSMLAFSGQE